MNTGWIVAAAFALLALAMLVLARISTAHADEYAARVIALQREVEQANSDRDLAKMYWEMQSQEARRLTKECYEARRLYASAAKERIELGRKLDDAQAMILQAELKLEEALKPRKRTPKQPVIAEVAE